MWLQQNNVGKNSSDAKRDKLIWFPDGSADTAQAGNDPVEADAVVLPTAGGTWTNFIAGTTTSDTAFAAAGYIECEFQGTGCRIPLVLDT